MVRSADVMPGGLAAWPASCHEWSAENQFSSRLPQAREAGFPGIVLASSPFPFQHELCSSHEYPPCALPYAPYEPEQQNAGPCVAGWTPVHGPSQVARVSAPHLSQPLLQPTQWPPIGPTPFAIPSIHNAGTDFSLPDSPMNFGAELFQHHGMQSAYLSGDSCVADAPAVVHAAGADWYQNHNMPSAYPSGYSCIAAVSPLHPLSGAPGADLFGHHTMQSAYPSGYSCIAGAPAVERAPEHDPCSLDMRVRLAVSENATDDTPTADADQQVNENDALVAERTHSHSQTAKAYIKRIHELFAKNETYVRSGRAKNPKNDIPYPFRRIRQMIFDEYSVSVSERTLSKLKNGNQSVGGKRGGDQCSGRQVHLHKINTHA